MERQVQAYDTYLVGAGVAPAQVPLPDRFYPEEPIRRLWEIRVRFTGGREVTLRCVSVHPPNHVAMERMIRQRDPEGLATANVRLVPTTDPYQWLANVTHNNGAHPSQESLPSFSSPASPTAPALPAPPASPTEPLSDQSNGSEIARAMVRPRLPQRMTISLSLVPKIPLAVHFWMT